MSASLKDCRAGNVRIQNEKFGARQRFKVYEPELQMNEGKLDTICVLL